MDVVSTDDPSGAGEQAPAKHDPYSALRFRDFRLFLVGGLISSTGMQMQTAAVGWEIFERTHSALALGWVGLAQILPVMVLVLPAGQVADRYNRRRIIMTTQMIVMFCSAGLAMISLRHAPVSWMYGMLFVVGACRAFMQPAKSSMLPLIVPRERFSNAVTWNSSAFQFAVIVGPAMGGWLIAMLKGAAYVYVLNATAALAFFAMLLAVRVKPTVRLPEPVNLHSLGAGFGFLWRSPVIFGAMTLDMLAVLLGGAETLLPVYAHILHVGPTGYGWLRAAPGIGALIMSFALAHRPPMERSGRVLLWSVAGFGLATIVFGLSRWYVLSVAMLFCMGMLDMVSVVVRHTLIQLLTPDEMRGRVSAINSLFIGASNELGGFESGLVAYLFTPTLAVVSGGLGTVLVVASIAWIFPQLVRYGRLGSRPT